MALGAASRTDAGARTRTVLPVLGRRTRAAGAEIHVACLLAPVPRVERIARAALQRLYRRPRLPLRRVQFHPAHLPHTRFLTRTRGGPGHLFFTARLRFFVNERDNRCCVLLTGWLTCATSLPPRARYACRVQRATGKPPKYARIRANYGQWPTRARAPTCHSTACATQRWTR